MDPHDLPSSPGPAARRPSRRASLIGTLVAMAVVIGIGWLAWYLTQRPPAPAAAPSPARPPGAGGAGSAAQGGRGLPPTTVGVAVAERLDIPVIVEALGTVTPLATARVRPLVSGVLERVSYEEGQRVKRGQLLATIDSRPFEMALQQATGQRMRDEAQLEAARVTLERFRTLLRQDSIARQEVDTQQALVRQLEATLVVDKAAEGTARLNLANTRLVAPIDGRVGLRTVDVGNVVNASDANGVAVITQMSPIDVVFSVPQDLVSALGRAAAGRMPAQALDRSRAEVLEAGQLLSVDNLIDAQTGTVKAKARFANAKDKLFPNQFVNVRLQLETLQGATVVPVAAVRAGPQGDQVFVLNGDATVSLRAVRRGVPAGDKVQIVQGLAPGERVVTEGADRLRDGSRVTLPGDTPGRAAGPRAGASRPRATGGGSSATPAP